MLVESCKSGKVIVLLSPEGELFESCVAVTFEDISAAKDCASALHGRWFDGRELAAQVFPPSGLSHNQDNARGLGTNAATSSSNYNTYDDGAAMTVKIQGASASISGSNNHSHIEGVRDHSSIGDDDKAFLKATDVAETKTAEDEEMPEAKDVEDFLNSLL
jgi:hypothetical protein